MFHDPTALAAERLLLESVVGEYTRAAADAHDEADLGNLDAYRAATRGGL
jgi:hypothetical protein